MDQSDQESQIIATFILCAFPDAEFNYHWDPTTSKLEENEPLNEHSKIDGEKF
jgi:hypothetical protein